MLANAAHSGYDVSVLPWLCQLPRCYDASASWSRTMVKQARLALVASAASRCYTMVWRCWVQRR
jgi:hypothetical protein